MMQKLHGWIMPEEDARNLMNLINEKLQSLRLDQRHHDALLKLSAMLEDDLIEPMDALVTP
ncbi:hypothetical protein [Microvirga aerophila]|uniref:Uncharacterized protein n=1 Tax=Microvirga aerophila TaxID=670291 RepID=A0A512BVJ3_9HYPH|nr:hypothetical protein [Microvirga aerophila]GEO15991.1 hypothetical protein MAE02_36870 [Microvirga aerophila]